MTGTLFDTSTTAADNDDALLAVGVDFREGQTPGSLNNSARALMAATRAWLTMALGAVASTGSANAYVYTSPGSFTLSAYVEGVRVGFVANHSNSGAATLNVDGKGATAIRKNGTTALVTGDIVSGRHYEVVYDAGAAVFQLVGERAGGVFQPLDATLTALAALSTAANQYILATGTDTFSMASVTANAQSLLADSSVPRLSITNAWTGANTWSRGGLPGRFTNTTDAAANQCLIIESDRATPTAFDQAYLSFQLSDSAGNQDEFGRISCQGTSITSTTESGRLIFSTIVSGSLTALLTLQSGVLFPTTNDAITIGNSTNMFADGFWASGATHNFNNGNVVLAHDNTNARLDLTTGSLKARLPRSTESSGTLSNASSNTVVVVTGGVTINDGVHTADDVVMIYNNSASSITITQDTGMTLRLHGTATTGNRTLAARGLATIYFLSNTEAVVCGDVT